LREQGHRANARAGTAWQTDGRVRHRLLQRFDARGVFFTESERRKAGSQETRRYPSCFPGWRSSGRLILTGRGAGIRTAEALRRLITRAPWQPVARGSTGKAPTCPPARFWKWNGDAQGTSAKGSIPLPDWWGWLPCDAPGIASGRAAPAPSTTASSTTGQQDDPG